MVGYIFGGNSGNSYESLQKRRQTADLLRRQLLGEKPKTALEGVAALLKGAAVGYGDYRTEKEMDERTQGSVDTYNRSMESLLSPQGASGTPSMADAIMQGKPLGSSADSGNYRDAIASIESAGSGDYSAIGPTNAKMGRPLGRYQIMEANIGPWSKEALGREVTPDEFLKNPQLQDAIFDHQFQGYVSQYGPEGAAQAWLGGPGSVGKTNRKDVLGTSVGEYGRRFMNAYGGGREVASLDPSAGMGQPQNAAQAIETQAPTGGSSLSDEVAEFRATPEYAAQFPGRQPQQRQPQQVGGPNPFAADAQPQQAPVEMAGGGGRQATFGLPQAPRSAPFNPYEGISPDLIRGLSDPFLPPEMKQSLQGVIEQRMRANQQNYQAQSEQQQWLYRQNYEQQQRQADPSYQLDMDAKRAQIEALKARPAKQWQKLDDDTLFNPETGETRELSAAGPDGAKAFRFGGNSVEAQSLNGLIDSGQLTPGQAQQLGAGKTITGPNGEIIFMTPQGVFSQSGSGGGGQPVPVAPMSQSAPAPAIPSAPMQSTGVAPAPVAPQAAASQQTGMIPLTEPKVTIDEKKAMTFADRMKTSGALIDQHGAAGEGIWDTAVSKIPIAGNYMVSDEYQSLDQARRDFINAQLRRESGAVISPEEFTNAEKQYFPQPGDNPATIEQKRRNRETVVNGMARDGGPTYGAQSPSKSNSPADPLGIR